MRADERASTLPIDVPIRTFSANARRERESDASVKRTIVKAHQLRDMMLVRQ